MTFYSYLSSRRKMKLDILLTKEVKALVSRLEAEELTLTDIFSRGLSLIKMAANGRLYKKEVDGTLNLVVIRDSIPGIVKKKGKKR